MHTVRKKIVLDEESRPVAVQIDYVDWLEIEELLNTEPRSEPKIVDLSKYAGVISLTEDPLEYQARIRGEWD